MKYTHTRVRTYKKHHTTNNSWMSDLVCHLHDPQTNNQKLARGASLNAPPANDANVTLQSREEQQRRISARRRKIILRC